MTKWHWESKTGTVFICEWQQREKQEEANTSPGEPKQRWVSVGQPWHNAHFLNMLTRSQKSARRQVKRGEGADKRPNNETTSKPPTHLRDNTKHLYPCHTHIGKQCLSPLQAFCQAQCSGVTQSKIRWRFLWPVRGNKVSLPSSFTQLYL